ncbi:MAG: hypothetical protein II938_01245 [Alphaproteobacteria bacterium]|nr:hypothetical protein [Alphaproteobacteria bacterium]
MSCLKVLFISCVFISSAVWAFGGGGGGRSSNFYKRHNPGVDSVGIHYHTDGHHGDFCLVDLSNDPNAEQTQEGVYQCKAGAVLDCKLGRCRVCEAGTYVVADDNDCVVAPAGYYAPEGASAPIPCPVGTYSAGEGAVECTEAAPGFYVDHVGATEQTSCPDGTYSDAPASASCKQTDPGYEPAVPTADDQVPCSIFEPNGSCGCSSNQHPDGQGGCTAQNCKTFTSRHTGDFEQCCENGYPYCISRGHGGEEYCEEASCCTTLNYYEPTSLDDSEGICCLDGKVVKRDRVSGMYIVTCCLSTESLFINSPTDYFCADPTTVYCKTTDSNGNCTEYAACPENATCDGDNIVCNAGYSLFENECITNSCPEDHQWKRATEDYCKDCSTPTDPQSATTVEDCIGKCVGYRYVGKNKSGDPKCWSCAAPNYSVNIGTEHDKTESSCNACLNRYYSNGNCVCDSDHAYDNNTKCCPPGQHANSDKTGCVDDSTTEDVTDCSGKNDGIVCSAVNSSLLENPSHELPICISENCTCPYDGWSLDIAEGICIQQPDGWGEANCNKLTEKEVACSVGGDGQFIQYACVDKNSSFNGAVIDDSQLGCLWTCGEDRDAETGCCTDILGICITPPEPDSVYIYTDAGGTSRTLSYCTEPSSGLEGAVESEPYLSVPSYVDGEWSMECVSQDALFPYCQEAGFGDCMLTYTGRGKSSYSVGIGYCPDEAKNGQYCIDPAAIQPIIGYTAQGD